MPREDLSRPNVDPRYQIEPFEPAYLALHRNGTLPSRVEDALAELACCRCCPCITSSSLLAGCCCRCGLERRRPTSTVR